MVRIIADMRNWHNQYPDKWKEACYNLSGYWKVMSNIFHSSGFKSLLGLKARFEAAGFVPLKTPPETDVLYSDMETWKNPEVLY